MNTLKGGMQYVSALSRKLLPLSDPPTIPKIPYKMASIGTIALTLTTAPSGYSKPSPKKLSSPVQLPVYPAGPSFIGSARRQILQRSFEQDDAEVTASREAYAAANNVAGEGDLYPGLGEEEEEKDLLANDPKEWKKQDHYAVLGLGNLRYKATEDHIRVARKLYRPLYVRHS